MGNDDDDALRTAVAAMADILGGDAAEGLRHFSCREAETFCAVLLAGGYTEEAANALYGHAMGDHEAESDWHWHVDSEEAAAAYLSTMRLNDAVS